MAKLRISRKGYVTKRGVRVAPATFYVPDRGAPGRGKKLFEIEKGRLTKYGYSAHNAPQTRHAALNRAVRAYGATTVKRMINAQILLRKRTQPAMAKVFKSDANWLNSLRFKARYDY